jgi:NAD+ dependent glucose-6-phosphate dehydrogenase
MRVVITGAAGRIGTQAIEELADAHALVLLDRRRIPDRPTLVADLAWPSARRRWLRWFQAHAACWLHAFAGADVVLHLAANRLSLAPWRHVLPDNIVATWNVIEAAARHGVARVVFASSNWAVKALERELAPACYTADGPKIGSDAYPRPVNAYGISKALGEIAGRAAVEEGQLRSFVAVRIGSYIPGLPRSETESRLRIGTRDLRSLLRRCVEAEFDGFHVVYAVSAQPTAPYDLSYTRQLLSWEPQELS